jgi:hypothetical protein
MCLSTQFYNLLQQSWLQPLWEIRDRAGITTSLLIVFMVLDKLGFMFPCRYAVELMRKVDFTTTFALSFHLIRMKFNFCCQNPSPTAIINLLQITFFECSTKIHKIISLDYIFTRDNACFCVWVEKFEGRNLARVKMQRFFNLC